MIIIGCSPSNRGSYLPPRYMDRSNTAEIILPATIHPECLPTESKLKDEAIANDQRPGEGAGKLRTLPIREGQMATPHADFSPPPQLWQSWPVIPHVSDTARQFFGKAWPLATIHMPSPKSAIAKMCPRCIWLLLTILGEPHWEVNMLIWGRRLSSFLAQFLV